MVVRPTPRSRAVVGLFMVVVCAFGQSSFYVPIGHHLLFGAHTHKQTSTLSVYYVVPRKEYHLDITDYDTVRVRENAAEPMGIMAESFLLARMNEFIGIPRSAFSEWRNATDNAPPFQFIALILSPPPKTFLLS